MADVGDVGGEGAAGGHVGEGGGADGLGHGKPDVQLCGFAAATELHHAVVDVGGEARPGTDGKGGTPSGGQGRLVQEADLIAVGRGLLQTDGVLRVVLHGDRLDCQGRVALLHRAEVQGAGLHRQGVQLLFDHHGGLECGGGVLPGLEGDSVGVGAHGQALLGDDFIFGLFAVFQRYGVAPHGGDGKVVVSFYGGHLHAGGALVLDGDGDFRFLGFLLGVALLELTQVLAGGVCGDGVAAFHHGGAEVDVKGAGAAAAHEGGGDGQPPVVGPRAAGAGQLHRDGGGAAGGQGAGDAGDAVAAGGGIRKRHRVITVVFDREGLGPAAAGRVLLQGAEVHGGGVGEVAGGRRLLGLLLGFFFWCFTITRALASSGVIGTGFFRRRRHGGQACQQAERHQQS